MYSTIKEHTFRRVSGVYLSPTYIRDDGKYKILSRDRTIMGTWKRVYVVIDEDGSEITHFRTLREAKISFGVERSV